MSESIEVPSEKNGNGDKSQYGMEPAIVLLINNETGVFEWQDIPHPDKETKGTSWQYKILVAAFMEFQFRLLALAQGLWQDKIRSFGLVPGGPGIQKAGADILKKLDKRGMKRR